MAENNKDNKPADATATPPEGEQNATKTDTPSVGTLEKKDTPTGDDPASQAPAQPENPPAKDADPEGAGGDKSKPQDDPDNNRFQERPQRYIPLKKYEDEKKDWNERASTAEEKVNELTAILQKLNPDQKGSGTGDDPDDMPEINAEALQDYADKHAMDPDMVKDMIPLLLPILKAKANVGVNEKAPNLTKKDIEVVTNFISSQKEADEKAFDEKEWNEVAIPSLKKLYPDATDDQLKKAQEVLDPIAHSDEGRKYKYGYIVFDNQDALKSIFDKTDKENKPAAGPEHGQMGKGGPSSVTAKDFEGDKPDFTLLDTLEVDDKRKIIKGMSTSTYQKFITYESSKGGLEINRGGRKISLK